MSGGGTTRTTPAFLAALLVLASSGTYLRYAKARGQLNILKKAAPLQRSLTDMRRDALLPYVVRDSGRLPPESEEELGTREYLEWAMEDPGAPEDSWRRAFSLFITYYTGKPDQVPHVPEECYVQGAFQKDRDDVLETHSSSSSSTVSLRRLTFLPPYRRGPRPIVYYSICVNGDFYTDRYLVRIRMGSPGERYLYYSKVEIAFRVRATDEASDLPAMDRLAEQLMGRVIPVLVREHWPDMKALERAERGEAR